MDINDIRKALAGLCIAGLVSGAGLVFASSGEGQAGAGGGNQMLAAGKTG